MTRARDVANVLSSATGLATDVETAAAISSHLSAAGHTTKGNTASKPASPSTGDIYINTETGYVEVYTTSGWSQIGGQPSVVTDVVATNSGSGRAYNNGRASVAFTPGSIIGTSYTVTSSPGSYTASGSSSPIVVTGLQSNTGYTYTVTTTNLYGVSAASSASSSVTATTVPQAPTISAATGNASATITITPGATGGSSITGYSITSSPATTTQTTSNTTYTFTGLTNGTSYTFTATATNANGASLSSSASSSITPAAPTLTGGTLASDSTYYYRTFTGTGNLVVSNASVTADILKIAGGGGTHWGGGGAGGVLLHSGVTLSPGTYTATVGAAGVSSDPTTSGTNSSFTGLSDSIGGGRGANQFNNPSSGGSGGGGSGSSSNNSGAAGTVGQGNNGGAGSGSSMSGGGGGGAGGAGNNSTQAYVGGTGGLGTNAYSSWATATSTGQSGYYAAGAGGYYTATDSVLGKGVNTGGAASSGIIIVRWAK